MLKIPEVGTTFTLDAINTINKGLVEFSNAYKGELFMPRALRYANLKENTITRVHRDVKVKN